MIAATGAMDKDAYVSFDSILSGQSLTDLISSKDGRLDISRFDALMRGVLEESAKTANVPKHKLVRIIRNGRVQWTTAEAANKMIDYHRNHSLSDDSETIANNLEKAIHGDIAFIEQEMLLLLCLAESGGGSDEEFVKKLERRRVEILRLVSEVRSSESTLNRRKRESGVVDQFEEKMGLMINAREKGHEEYAYQIASELKLIKNKYLLFTRGLAPDIQKIRQLRGELVRCKEKVLTHMLEGLQVEAKSVSLSLESLQQNMERLEKSFQQTADSNHSCEEDLDQIRERIKNVQKSIETKSERMQTIQQEAQNLKQEIATTKAVADQMDTDSTDDALKDSLSKHQNTSRIKKEPGLDKLIEKKEVSRMHIERDR